MFSEIPNGQHKKQRLYTACDLCKSKKIRCDSDRMPCSICSNCRAFGSECTRSTSGSKKKRKEPFASGCPPTDSPNFEFAKAQIADILSISAPYKLPGDSSLVLKTLVEIASYARSLENELKNQSNSDLYPLGSPPNTLPEQDYPNIDLEVSDAMKHLELQTGLTGSFFGKDSHLGLVKEAISIRNGCSIEGKGGAELKRREFWDIYPWQKLREPTNDLLPLIFPDPDLLNLLVDLYFRRHNVYFPLLHRPTFEQGLRDGLHKKDQDFGELVLSVCGLGARYTNDPRALADGTESKHSLGWKYFDQIFLTKDLTRVTLYRVQIIVNALTFLRPTSTPGLCWPLLGLGIRFAQIAGAHRRNFFGPNTTVTAELWKRAFWCLVCIDTHTTSFTGRPRATNPADYDLDYPADIDDEYWLHPDPEQAFKQPSGQPSRISFWIHFLKLMDICGLAQRSIFAVKKPERWASNSAWDERMVSELHAALNTWVDTIPEHLRWDPQRADSLFFIQSAMLYSEYYQVQIQIHRGSLKHSNITYSSLAVSANAARSSTAVLARLHARGGENTYPTPTIVTLGYSAIVLLLSSWSGKQLGLVTDPIRDVANINKCLNALSSHESRWQFAGRMRDILSELMSERAVPTLMAEFTPRSTKRPYYEDKDKDANNGTSSMHVANQPSSNNTPSKVAGPSFSPSRFSIPATPNLQEFVFQQGLPLYTDDMRRFPVHLMPDAPRSGCDIQTAPGAEYHTGPTSREASSLIADSTNILYLQEPSLSTFVGSDVSGLETPMQAQTLFNNGPSKDPWDDWDAYIATVDELLRSLNGTS